MLIIFRGYTYYKINNLDNRISNPDQLLTADVDKFCDMFTDLYSNVCKPFLENKFNDLIRYRRLYNYAVNLY